MNAVPLRKDEFLEIPTQEKEESVVLLPTPKEPSVTSSPKLPFGLKLPAGRSLFNDVWPPMAGIGGFLALWALLAPLVQTSLGALPGPGDVWTAFLGLLDEAAASRVAATEAVAAG
jgi:nitrate/nitrite transport system permease protein